MDYSNPPYQPMHGSGVPGMPGTPAPGMPGSSPVTDKPGKRAKGGKGDGKQPTKKVVNRQFVIAFIFAIVAGLAIVVVTKGTAPAGHWVVVASSNIATNTEVDVRLLKAVSIPVELTQPGAVTASSPQEALAKAEGELKGVRTQFPITANEQIIPEQFGPVVNLDAPLAPDERLVSFRATVAASVAGSIKPGDHVDMYVSAGDLTGPIAYNVPIVSVTVSEDRYNAVADAQSGNKDVRASDVLPGDPVPGTYVVRVKADEVGKVIASDNGGKIYLVYRAADANDAQVAPTTAKDAICATGGTGVLACQ